MVTAGTLKKVQFYITLALVAGVAPVAAAERLPTAEIPIKEIHRQLAQKIEMSVSRELRACGEDEREQGREKSKPPYPVRIAARQPVSHGVAVPLVWVPMAP